MPLNLSLRRTDSCGSNDSENRAGFEEKISLACDFVLTLVSSFALYSFHTQVANGDFAAHWPLYFGFSIMLLNGIIGLVQYLTDNAYCSLHCLFDYLQVNVVFPCYASELWLKYEMEPQVLSNVIPLLGILPALAFIVSEFKKQIITDITLAASAGIVTYIAATNKDYFAVAAALIFVVSYAILKRKDIVCDEPLDVFNGIMTLFVLFSLLSLDVTLPLPESLAQLFSGNRGNGGGDESNGQESAPPPKEEESAPPPEEESAPPPEEFTDAEE